MPLEREVVLRFEHFKGFIAEYSRNISMGGMFIRSEAPKPPGAEFRFEVGLQDGFPLVQGRGSVVWRREVAEGPERPTGMGVRFVEIDDSSRRLIRRVVEEWVKEGGEPFDLEKEAPRPPAAPAAPQATSEEPPAAPVQPPAPQAAAQPAPDTVSDPPAAPGPADVSKAPAAPAAAASVIGIQSIGEAKVAPSAGASPPAELPVPSGQAAASAGPAVPAAAWTPPDPAPEPKAAAARRGAAGARRRGGRRGPLIALAGLALIVALGLVWRWRAGETAAPGPSASAATVGEAADEPRPGTGEPPAAGEPSAAGETDGGEPVTGGGDAAVPSPVGSGAAPEPAAPGPAEGRAPAGAGSSQTAAESPAADRPLAAVRDIRWRREGTVLVVEIATQGGVRPADYVSAPLGGTAPRHLIRLLGVTQPFARSSVTVGEPEVARIRTGYHQLAAGNELHVVFDLTGGGVELAGIEAERELLRLRFRSAR